MTHSATASDALLARATDGIPALNEAVNGFRISLQDFRRSADLVGRMTEAARYIMAAEHIEEAAKAVVGQARAALAEVMAENGITLDIGTHTVFTADRGGVVKITDEAAIPAEYMRQPPPAADKIALGKALREGAQIPGAVLTNGGVPSLNFRSKKAKAA